MIVLIWIVFKGVDTISHILFRQFGKIIFKGVLHMPALIKNLIAALAVMPFLQDGQHERQHLFVLGKQDVWSNVIDIPIFLDGAA